MAKGRRGGRLAALAVVVAAALLVVRLAGPGGSPAVDPAGPSPAPPPAAKPDPGPSPSPSPPPAAPARPALRGRVLSAAGAPVEGARVEALFEMGPGREPVVTESLPTGPDGAWELSGAPAAWKGVLLRAIRGPLSSVVDLGETPGSAADGMVMDLPLPAVFSVGGLAISAEEGRPLEDMEVAAGDRTARTDARGRFRIEGIPAREPWPALSVKGAGRKPLTLPLPVDRPLDDLLLRVERE